MQFRDLHKQYEAIKVNIDKRINTVIQNGNFISGKEVTELEKKLADYVGVKHCITCANGTDALSLALMSWGIGKGDAVFVPDFTFFASGEVVSFHDATPIFVDVDQNTYNLSSVSLEMAIEKVISEKKLIPKVVVAVDLFGLPADYDEIIKITKKYNLLLLEDGAQGFGGSIRHKKACSFGDISTTSFFPAKPLGCYGDGGAIFTNSDEHAELIRSLCVHGKGKDKYDNIRIGLNSRLDTIQAAILLEKFNLFVEFELESINRYASYYSQNLTDKVKLPIIKDDFISSWAQYTIQTKDNDERVKLQQHLQQKNIPNMIYYQKPMHLQKAFDEINCSLVDLSISTRLCETVLSLPIHPYMNLEDMDLVITAINEFYK
ncbi:MAG: aminotransferase DegT [Herbinix sp.]|jgi:dTDP-4-amino-4,6-dideoxygalactose transaminase|nr:aminotransferase DegT [Herbinix sp.]